jgi:hypothetical protein
MEKKQTTWNQQKQIVSNFPWIVFWATTLTKEFFGENSKKLPKIQGFGSWFVRFRKFVLANC